MDQLTLQPIDHVAGVVNLPGSKSLSNRALLLAALASGTTRLTNLLQSDDTRMMINALRQLGISIALSDDWRECTVRGNNGLFTSPNEHRFFLGNAGTAIRPLTAALAMMPGRFEIDGDEYMRERPIGHLVDALRQLGVSVRYLGVEGCPPIVVEGGNVKGGTIDIDGSLSSQYLTSLLMALPLAKKDSTINVIGEQVSTPYLDITLHTMARFGVTATHENHQQFRIAGGQQYTSPETFLIEGDASSASYFFAAAAINGSIRVNGVGHDSVQGDVAFLDVIELMGAKVTRYANHVDVESGSLVGVDVDLNHIPDAAMTIAAMALFAEGRTTIRNIYNWRIKETDRMTAMATELRKVGAVVETGNDFIVIDPPEDGVQAAAIDTYGDHRMAMCFSLAAMGNAAITINDPDCTRKTFPDYFSVFDRVAVTG